MASYKTKLGDTAFNPVGEVPLYVHVTVQDTGTGKARSSRNAYKGSVRQQLRALNIELCAELKAMREFNKLALA